jgi:hypothetical protein
MTLAHDRIHAAVEQRVIADGERLSVRTAILSLPAVHGIGKGPVKKEGCLGVYVDAVIKHGMDFVINQGKNVASQVHVSDVSSAVELLVERALSTPQTNAIGWGKDGYYFVEAEELPFVVQAESVARLFVARGLIESVEVEHLRPEAVKKIHPYALVMWGTNHRARAQKLRAVGWMPAGPLKEKTVEEMVDAVLEARNDN